MKLKGQGRLRIRLKLVTTVTVVTIAFSPACRRAENTAPPPDPEKALAKANIVLSKVDARQVRAWLGLDTSTKPDPAYQALARCCLSLLEGKKVVSIVPLDVINGKYRQVLGYDQATYLKDDMYAASADLEKAIFLAWKDDHPNSTEQSFSQIVENR